MPGTVGIRKQNMTSEFLKENQFTNNGGGAGPGVNGELDFSCSYTTNLPALFSQLNFSVAFTSYQAGRLMVVRSDGEKLDINFKSFPRPMGLATTKNSLTLGTFTQVIKFQRDDRLLRQIKKPLPGIEDDITAPRLKDASKKNDDGDEDSQERYKSLHEPVDARVDACFITRSTHHTGMINIHDIAWGEQGLWAVNSSFSCLATLEPDYSFVPRWKPPFISALAPEDRCHLNGMAMEGGKPAYVTTFSKFDEPSRWRKSDHFDGTLIDVQSNEIVADGLTMPHSPRCYRGKVYFCDSGHGRINCYDPMNGSVETLVELPGYSRGMDFFGSIMVVGLSRVRQTNVARPAPVGQKFQETWSGVWLINLEDSSVIGSIRFTGNVDQIYDVSVVDHCAFPEIIEPSHPRMRNHFCYPSLNVS